MIKPFRLLNNMDHWLLFGLFLLVCISELCLVSAANGWSTLCTKQALHFALGFIIFAITSRLSAQKIYDFSPYVFTISLIMLIAVALAGSIGKGAQRWLVIGAWHIQPSEFMKFTLPFMLAWFWDKQTLPMQTKPLVISLALIALPVALVLKQPDLGTALILASCGLSLLLLVGLSWRFITTSLILFISTLPFLWSRLHSYQQQRVLTFLNPDHDPLGAGYHSIQAKIAIGSGGIWGKGWLHGTQAHFHFLPEKTTDFVFALWAEEFGFFGCILLLLIFFGLSLRLFWLANQSPSLFTQRLSGSLACLFTLSYLINIGMVCGLLPVVGVPLPWVSYGGSAVVLIACCLGMINGLSRQRYHDDFH